MKAITTSKNRAGSPVGAVVRRFGKARQIAARHGICSKTIFRLADKGLIDRFKLGERLVVFDEDQVAALFESARITTAGPPSQGQGIAHARLQSGPEDGGIK